VKCGVTCWLPFTGISGISHKPTVVALLPFYLTADVLLRSIFLCLTQMSYLPAVFQQSLEQKVRCFHVPLRRKSALRPGGVSKKVLCNKCLAC
jgi:hypothetical protein